MVPELSVPLKVARTDYCDVTINQTVFVGIRPEFIRVSESDGENTVSCYADRLIESVTGLHYHFRAEADRDTRYKFEVNLSGDHIPVINEGQFCQLQLPPNRLILLTE
jgi:hypothetical protein